jgi:predicted deacylase
VACDKIGSIAQIWLRRASRQRRKRLALPDAVADAVQDIHTGDAGAHPGASLADRQRPAAAADCRGEAG